MSFGQNEIIIIQILKNQKTDEKDNFIYYMLCLFYHNFF